MPISKQNLSFLHEYYLLMCAKFVLKCQKNEYFKVYRQAPRNISREKKKRFCHKMLIKMIMTKKWYFNKAPNFGHFECISPSDGNVLHIFSSIMHKSEKQLIDIILKYLFRLACLVSSILSADISVCFKIMN